MVEVIRLAVTGSAAGTGVHTAATVASLMGFNPTRCRRHYGTVNPLRWETSHTSALINTHRCRCDAALEQALPYTHTQAHTHIQPSSRICQQFLTRNTISFFSLFPHTSLVPCSCLNYFNILSVTRTSLCVIIFYKKKYSFSIWNI